MKKLCLAIMIMISMIGLFGQVSDYIFSQEVGTYTEITSGIALGNTSSSDHYFLDPTLPTGSTTIKTGVGLPIGFDFVYNGLTFDRIGISTNGWIAFGSSLLNPSVDMNTSGSYNPLSSTTIITPSQLNNRVAVLAMDLNAQTGSSIRLETVGASPNRVCVVQWKGYRYSGATGTNYNFQIQLEETSNRLYFVYGNFTNNSTLYNAQIGLGGIRSDYFKNLGTTPNWSFITPGTSNSATCQLQDAIKPANGQTFIWTAPSFTNPPSAAVLVSPTDGQTGVQIDKVLSWKSCDGKVTGYKLWLGTDNPPSNLVNGLDVGNVCEFDPASDLSVETSYYWQVVPYNENGDSSENPVWAFKTWSYVLANVTFPGVTSGVMYAGISGNMEWGDYDNNGYKDLLITGITSGANVARIYKNSGIDTFTNVNANFTGGGSSYSKWGDIDNDGDLDVAICGTSGYPNNIVFTKLYRNDGNGFFVDLNAAVDAMYGYPLYWGDYDNDGLLDLLYHHDDGAPRLYHNNGNCSFSRVMPSTWFGGVNYGGFASWIDYDNDGDLDVFASNGGNAALLRNDGANVFTVLSTNISGGNKVSVDWGDYDNDGDVDLCISNGLTKIYRNDGNAVFTDINANLISVNSGSVKWGDYNNDGMLDLTVTGQGTQYQSKLYRNQGNGIFVDVQAPLISTGGANKAVFVDYNNDGRLDILYNANIGYHTYAFDLYRNVVSNTNTAPSTPNVEYDDETNMFRYFDAIDDTTPTQALTYNLRIGTTPGGIDVLSPMSDITTGYCRIVSRGCSVHKMDLAPNQTYYASAQAIDNSFQGSPFSNEITITTPSLQILYPNGGETLVSGRTSYIRWAENSVQFLRLQYTTDDGANWINVTTSSVPSSHGVYYYTVPITNSTQCKMRILWAKDNSYFDDSDQVFGISSSSTEPTLAITYPTATGVNITPTQAVNIAWTSGNVAAISLDYTIDNGFTWVPIVENRPAALSPYSWVVPDFSTTQARIRIRSTVNGNYYDISDNTFTICKITVLSPNGGEVLTADYSGMATIPITWTAQCVTNVILYYSTNNGTNWTTIGTVAASTGVYNWTLPALESAACLIKISHSSASGINDTSNSVFTIGVPVKFINVNGGSFVNNNCNYTIRWSPLDIPLNTQVHLEYSSNNSTWTRINDTTLSVIDLHYAFFMTLGDASQVWFRMVNAGSSAVIAKSSSAITVTGKTLHISTPEAGEGLAVESYTTITWTADGCSNLNIYYTADFGKNWTQIGSNIPSTQGCFVWLVPNTISSQCRIKLSDTTYSYMNIESDGEFTILAIDLIASFYATTTTGVSDLVVQFHDQSIGYISSWAWDFDNDGLTDTIEQNPIWIFRKSGFYTIKLTVWDGTSSVTMTRTNYIYVLPMEADFIASETSGFVPFTIQFTDQTPSDITQWSWDFDNDGIFDSEDQNPYWTYLFPGIYSVKQHVTNGFDSDDEIKTEYINVTLNPVITHYVPTDYLTIQAAINASNDGDYIIVADGTYYENLVIEGKSITIGSYFFVDGDSTHIANTIIDGGNAINPDQGSTLTILPGTGRPDTKPHIVGFTIRNGSGRRIIQNTGGATIEKRVGGGVYIRQANPIFSYNRIEDNEVDDEGGGSYAFQSVPNHGGMVDSAIGLYNPGGNFFCNNHADVGADVYVYGVTTRDAIKLENCNFEVFSVADTTVSNYWANSSAPLSFAGCSGVEAAISTDIFVATDGSDAINSGTTESSPFKTIDHALSRAYGTATNPITIHIASGTYSPSLTGEKYPLQMVKHVSLQGSGKDETFLDAEASVDFPRRVLNLDNVEGVTVSDLSLMGGFVTLIKNYNGGGIGVINSALQLSNALLANNSAAGNGSAMYAYDSSVVMDSLAIEYNSSLNSGGGIYASGGSLILNSSSINNNSVSKNGAGIFADGTELSIQNCDITNNQASGSQSKGGGLCISNTNNAIVRGNLIKANNADLGAGLYLQSNSDLKIDRNCITNNLADFNGGGMFMNTTSGLFANNLIANNTASQRGGALYCYSAPEIFNNTIVNNKANLQGGGLYQNSGSPNHLNTIYWGNVIGADNTPNQVYLYSDNADPNFSYCNVQGGSAGFALANGTSYSGTYLNNLDADPLFTSPSEAAGNFYVVGEAAFTLQDASLCIDSGDPNAETSLYPIDLAGNPRIDNTRIDMGAFETVHYNGAMISSNPAAIDFGRVNIHGLPPTAQLSITNAGNQEMQITSIEFETSGGIFTYETELRSQLLAPGASLNLNLTFSPTTIGFQTNNLIIHSNALNYPSFRVAVSGYGIDASTSLPSNVQLQVMDYDVHLTWNPVLSDPLGNPYTPEGYIVLYSENADTITDNYFFLCWTEEPNYIHSHVARYRNKMFYKVIAISEAEPTTMAYLDSISREKRILKWDEVKKAMKQPIFKKE